MEAAGGWLHHVMLCSPGTCLTTFSFGTAASVAIIPHFPIGSMVQLSICRIRHRLLLPIANAASPAGHAAQAAQHPPRVRPGLRDSYNILVWDKKRKKIEKRTRS